MSSRIAGHLRSNVVGYIALFWLMTGTALAVDGSLPGQNTVGSEDIIPGEVFGGDLAANSVGTGKVIDESLTGDDVDNGSIGGLDITNQNLTGADLANGSVFG